MGGIRIFILSLLCALALWSAAAHADEDPHLDLFPDMDEAFGEMEDFEPVELEPSRKPDTSALVIPFAPKKPEIPLLFRAAASGFSEWNTSRYPAPAPKSEPKREVASVPVLESKRLADSATEEEKHFQEQVIEAGIVPAAATYRKILSVLSGEAYVPKAITESQSK